MKYAKYALSTVEFAQRCTNMTDIILLICCILAGYALGKFFERKASEKGRFYRDLTSYITLLKDNVNGRQLELKNFNDEFTQNCGGAFANYLLNNRIKVRMTKSQKNNLTQFYDNLDCVSSKALVEHLDYYGRILSDDAQDVMKNEVAKASVYAKLGMLLGAMLGILLI